jgi:hypothetical protein
VLLEGESMEKQEALARHVHMIDAGLAGLPLLSWPALATSSLLDFDMF